MAWLSNLEREAFFKVSDKGANSLIPVIRFLVGFVFLENPEPYSL